MYCIVEKTAVDGYIRNDCTGRKPDNICFMFAITYVRRKTMIWTFSIYMNSSRFCVIDKCF